MVCQHLEMAKPIRYGSIHRIFRDGGLVQLDQSEKIRVSKE